MPSHHDWHSAAERAVAQGLVVSTPTVFIDRDGTLVEEPPDQQIDSLDKIRFMPGVFAALTEIRRQNYDLVMITNQDGLGTERFPEAAFKKSQAFILDAFDSQGISFKAIFVCPHFEAERCSCRKPKTGLLDTYLRQFDIDRNLSAVIGDRDTDRELAVNLGVRALTVRRHGTSDETWPSVVQELLARRAEVSRQTQETRIQVQIGLDVESPVQAATGIGFFDHMLEALAKHGGFSLGLKCDGDLHVDEHHTVEDCALALGQALRRALGNKLGIARYGFTLPMDESEAAVSIDLSGRPYLSFSGNFPREVIGTLPTELVSHFFRSLAEGLGAAIHVTVRGENTHHMIEACFKGVGRALRQAARREGGSIPSTKGIL
jgi:imidazoleglycerol-phosphate dehydratase / histidinol-phosphatase